MQSPLLRRLLSIVGLMFLLLIFNNCGEFKGTSEAISQMDLESKFAAEGKMLYAVSCSGCHNPLETSTRLHRSSSDVKLAISNQSAMGFLNYLTDVEVEKIAAALNAPVPAPPVPPPPTQGEPTDYKALTTNRYMLKSNFQELFVADTALDASDTAINTILDKYITGHPEAFGGNCSRYDTGCSPVCGTGGSGTCVGLLDTLIQASPTASVSALTEGYIQQTCEEVLNIDKAVQTAVLKSELNIAVSPTASDVNALADVFFRGKPLPVDTSYAIRSVADQARADGYSVLDQWRFLLLPMCTASAGQLL